MHFQHLLRLNTERAVFQTVHCNHYNVKKCYQYNPFKKYEKYLDGFNYNIIGRIISFYKNNLSITGNIFWRTIRQLKLADSILDPEGEKAVMPTLFNEIENSLLNDKVDIVFSHLLIPHVPNVFDNSCKYDRSRGIYYNFSSEKEKIHQHNIERKCTFIFIEKLFDTLKKKNIFKNTRIIILSDHDSRIEKRDKNSVLFAIKETNSKNFKIINNNISSQQIFKTRILD